MIPRRAIILAGGLGSRLGEIAKKTPKPLLNVNGEPFLNRLVRRLAEQRVTDIILCVGHQGDKIKAYYGNSPMPGINVEYVEDPQLLGTGGALRNALPLIGEDGVFVLNGDSFCEFDLERLVSVKPDPNILGALTLVRMAVGDRYGEVLLDQGSKVAKFIEKYEGRRANESSLINAGVYFLTRELVEGIPAYKKISLEREVFPPLAENGELVGVTLLSDTFIDIGVPDTLAGAGRFFDNLQEEVM